MRCLTCLDAGFVVIPNPDIFEPATRVPCPHCPGYGVRNRRDQAAASLMHADRQARRRESEPIPVTEPGEVREHLTQIAGRMDMNRPRHRPLPPAPPTGFAKPVTKADVEAAREQLKERGL